ncbi:hypothetical protein M0R45_028175 [Rubus argutus]|uniref:KRR-R motif-containing protein 1 n=1 Tax=Rubus argutus TaxID=59490 RepID=A0AAW1W534_RUBAR
MEDNQNGVVDMLKMEDPKADHMEENDNFGPDSLDEEDEIDLEVITFSRRFPKHIKTSLQKDWPIVESALQDYHISCSLNLVKCSMTFSTTRPTDQDIIDKARDLLHLLSVNVPAPQAIKAVNGSHWDIIEFGYQKDGVCSKFGISREQFLEQRKQLSHPSLKEFGDLIWCDIFTWDDTFVAVGSFKAVKVVRKIVEECIVHKVPIAARIKTAQTIKAQVQAQKNLDDLRF